MKSIVCICIICISYRKKFKILFKIKCCYLFMSLYKFIFLNKKKTPASSIDFNLLFNSVMNFTALFKSFYIRLDVVDQLMFVCGLPASLVHFFTAQLVLDWTIRFIASQTGLFGNPSLEKCSTISDFFICGIKILTILQRAFHLGKMKRAKKELE